MVISSCLVCEALNNIYRDEDVERRNSGGFLRLQGGKGWDLTMKCTARYSSSPANRAHWQLSQFFWTYAMRKRSRFLSFPKRPLGCQSENENASAGIHLRVWNPKNCSITLIPSMPYLLTLLAIMEKLYCAVLSLSSNSLVEMVPSVASIVK